MITKGQASDLKSAIDSAQARALEWQKATFAKEQADRLLADLIRRMQQENEKEKKETAYA